MTAARFLMPGSLVAGARPIDRLFEQFLGYEAAIREDGTPTYALPLDILETEDAYELHATVAGVQQDGVEVTFESGMLSIAVKAAPVEVQGTFIRQERPWGNWSRKLELPKEIDPAKIAAQFENGVLRVRVPKAAKVQPVRIAIGGVGKASSLPKGAVSLSEVKREQSESTKAPDAGSRGATEDGRAHLSPPGEMVRFGT